MGMASVIIDGMGDVATVIIVGVIMARIVVGLLFLKKLSIKKK